MLTSKYTVITGASSGIGYEAAKAFAGRGKNLILVARRQARLATLKQEILAAHPQLDIVIKPVDLSVSANVHRLYAELADYPLETWVNNAGFGNYAPGRAGFAENRNHARCEHHRTYLALFFIHPRLSAYGQCPAD
jgi:short-subunit dehydrogenase